jgi:exodeoxyribonuclease III
MTEVKAEEEHAMAIPGFPYRYWNASKAKKGYAGTAVYIRVEPIGVQYGMGIEKHDQEGRLICCEYASFYLVNCYVPNSGQKLERLQYRTQEWDVDLTAYLKKLETKKPVVLCGDLNVCHLDRDLHSPQTNQKSAGFTPGERNNFTKLLTTDGFRDVYRHFNPDEREAYTYWGYRSNGRVTNKGWRLDYFVVSGSLLPQCHGCIHGDERVTVGSGKERISDHCPISLCLKVKK